MITTFWLNELNPNQTLSIWGDKIRNASRFPKYWDNGVLVDNPLYPEMYFPFFDIAHKSEQRKWGMSYKWEFSINGEVVLTRNAGHSSSVGVKTTNRYFDISDGILPSFESSYQHEFKTDILSDGFSIEEINKLRAALKLPEVNLDIFKFY
jgi:hypothetical protein